MSIKNSIISFLSLCLLAVALGSCDDSVDLSKERRSKNEKAFLSYKQRVGYERVSLPGLYEDSFVYMKWLGDKHKGDKPKQTDLVKMHYSGYLLTSWTNNPATGLFDSNTNLEVLHANPVDGFIEGVSIALQNMAVGDKVGVVIPWYLAYGAIGSGRIAPYSALYFELELNEIIKK